MSQLLGAYLTGGLVGLLAGALGAIGLGLHLLERVDRATTLPAPADEPPTERIPPVTVVDLPRRPSRTWIA